MAQITKTLIKTNNAFKMDGFPINQAVVADGKVYLSGCMGFDKDTMKLAPGGTVAEMGKALENMTAILEAAGTNVDRVVKVIIYLPNLKEFTAVSDEYRKVFTKDFPARSGVGISKLPAGANVVFDVVALTGDMKLTKNAIITDNAFKVDGFPVSQAVVADRTIYVAGCLGIDKDTMALVSGGAAAEMRKAFENMMGILEAAGSSADKVIQVTIFVTDMNDFAIINDEYKKVFPKYFPARTGIQIAQLSQSAKVAFDSIALIGDVPRNYVATNNAFKIDGFPVTQAVVAGRVVYVSGCLGIDKDSMKVVPGGAAAEMRKALENMTAILEAAGSSVDKVTKVTIFVTDMKEIGAINEEYKKVFTKDFPARTDLEIADLASGAKVSFDLVALVGEVKIVAK